MLNMSKWLMVLGLLMVTSLGVFAQDDDFIYGDLLPDAPELAARGEYGVGVRTLELVNPDQIDISNTRNDPSVRYDRPLTIEVWYPAIIPDDAQELTTYESQLGRADQNNVEPFTFLGRALRDAEPDTSGAAYPLVIVSHGYPGSRYMMTYLTENLASKGYVVVAIDHTDSTFSDTGNFFITLYNRALDQMFVLNEMARLNEEEGFLNGLVNADNTAIIGYSMGGYGALNAAGAGYNAVLQTFLPVIESRMAGNPDYEASIDPRIKAIVVFAPWGGDLSAFGRAGQGFWDLEALAGIEIPSFWVAGDLDDVANYEAIVSLFDSAVNSERYLLTYANALHNVAPNPPPPDVRDFPDYERYSEPAWDEARINNINQHFITAFLGQYLLGQDYEVYLNPAVENANDGVVDLDSDGNPTENHTYWVGFLPRTAVGMSLRVEHAAP
ncbi:MAG: dienelactone hydrolase [Phototrophicales bacterium]|nr:MAG: dienelactone hydrolase [Phototrophicales bacterium]